MSGTIHPLLPLGVVRKGELSQEPLFDPSLLDMQKIAALRAGAQKLPCPENTSEKEPPDP